MRQVEGERERLEGERQTKKERGLRETGERERCEMLIIYSQAKGPFSSLKFTS